CYENIVVASGPAPSAAWPRLHFLFIVGWLRDSLPWIGAHRTLGPHVERIAGRFPVSGRTLVAQAQAWRCGIMGSLLAFYLRGGLYPGRLHDCRNLGGR